MNNYQLISNYYAAHRDELLSFIAVRITNATEAEDLVQDIFLRLLRDHHLITPDTLPALIYTMARLPKTCCEIYRLHIYDGMKVRDIARELSLPYKQVENRLGQARKAVRQQLRSCV